MAKGGLGKWFAEEWTDVKTGKPCGRKSAKGSKRPYPACRPKAVAGKITKKEASKKTGPKRVKWSTTASGKKRTQALFFLGFTLTGTHWTSVM